ncbi:MAG: hypothetical protein M1816_005159 [Peltula sp. TS41687]|nr:MAG: hypothetical protein M1816_005159 [Peltula sp. TS41687]
MAASTEAPWSEAEKVLLLTEILKDARISSTALLGIITGANVEPRWNDIPLPPGRSLRSCQTVFHTLQTLHPRTSPGQLLQSPFTHPTQTGFAGATGSRKRGAATFKEPSTSATRALQPRPATFGSLNGEQTAIMQASPGEGGAVEPPRKKRGRPSRAEMEARQQAAAAAAARGDVYPPAKSPRTPKTAKAAERRSLGGNLDMTGFSPSLMPTATMVVATPSVSLGGPPGLAGSTGKRRRGRPTKAETEAKRALLEAAAAAHAAQNQDNQMDARHDTLDDDSAVARLMQTAAEEADEADEADVQMAGSLGVQSSATL